MDRRYPDGPVAFGFANEGGGTRKTSSAVNTAVALARLGKQVVVIDADQTMAASCYLGYGVVNRKLFPDRAAKVYSALAERPNIHGVLVGECTLTEALVPARTRIDNDAEEIGDDDDSFEVIPNLWLALGSREMAQASEDIRNVRKPKASETWLRRAIAKELPEGIDVVIVDFRGTLDTLETTLLAGIDYVIGVVKPERKDDDTLTLLNATIEDTAMAFEMSGGSAVLGAVLLNGRVTNRGRYYIDLFTEVQSFYGDLALPSITESVQIAESVDAQEPVHYWMTPDARSVAEFDAVARALPLVWQ